VCDTITFREIQDNLSRRFPKLETAEVEKLAIAFVELAGGKYVCGKKIAKEKRNAELKKLFTGKNLAELANEYHLSPRQLRRILKNL